MFLLPQGDKANVEGLSDTNPVVLNDVKKKDFEQLLKALMHRKYGENRDQPILEQGQWISVLKLSTMWEFGGLRRSAIDNLDGGSNPLNPVDKFLLALRYDVTEWTLSALLKLAQRPEPISIEEGRKLGLETALKIASVREKFRLRPQALCDYCENRAKNGKYLTVGNRDPETEKLDFTRKIRAAFDL
ncbi:hypothetical protein SCLCIDRAFT_1223236 [Scleroderma citrinum Foug A]|uniref:BTB domain-containing protein n=1 Tax=Scleroderma citrinum Foug A TaxID=1036808 RepID=A0A0C3DAD3_9AGAM|nr:hypothetical protein SCLCIDRAFT_1223236 [Scleroderma citrinum Foug A]